MSLQEKFQSVVPFHEEGKEPSEQWTKQNSQVVHSGNTGRGNRFNEMPPGYDATSPRDQFAQGFGGDTDVSGDVTPHSLEHGFQRLDMSPTAEVYTGEQVDLFYGEAVDEKGRVGFAERNNYLDRE